ncbi:MAG: Tad domain-containing protein [Sphingomonadaceae bacterium]|nr:Tad domain-containing protein [Sphingomonadaceae bacterium]
MTPQPLPAFLSRLSRDTSGNTLAMVAAALLPILAMMGGGLDMGRSYLSQSRLQQACDAGVLAARKRLGSDVAETGVIPAEVTEMGNRFFNINFRNGSYGTEARNFVMTLEDDYSISGEATVEVPTTLIQIFGFDKVDIAVTCEAQLNMNNTDIMFVLDTTGSMRHTNPGETIPRIDAMRSVISDFASQMQSDMTGTARLRYGFVPYASNVNVGGLLKSKWMVDEWTYQSRVASDSGNDQVVNQGDYYSSSSTQISGTKTAIATYVSSSCPADTIVTTWTDPVDAAGNPVDISTKPANYYRTRTRDGIDYACSAIEGGYEITGTNYNNVVDRFTYTLQAGYSYTYDIIEYDYKPVTLDVSGVKGASGDAVSQVWSTITTHTYSPTAAKTYWYEGCIEERETYEIHNYDNVNLDRALDLNIDLVPDPTDDDTRWRPKFMGLDFARAIFWNGSGSFSNGPVNNTRDEYVVPFYLDDLSACPTPARKLGTMTAAEVDSYLASLDPAGKTNHDLGMIWGGRLLSPTGLFQDENADVDGVPTSRHLIFLTDGQTEPSDLVSGAYGIEPIDRRRWKPSSSLTMTEMVEARFTVACNEVKKKNITVWVIAFGTELNPIMTECAGAGHYFEAADSVELNAAFAAIAEKMKRLRITD